MSVIYKPILLLLISFSLTVISACGGSSEGSRSSSTSSTSSSSSSNSSSSGSSGPSSSSSSSSSSSGTPIVDPGGFKIEAEAFSAESAPADGNPISVIDLPGGITKVGFITNDSWLRFNGVSFGEVTEWAGPNGADIAFTLAKGSADDASTIEVRIDSPTGPILTIVNVPPTGGWDQFQTFYGSFNQKVSGTKDLYFVFKGPGFVTDLDYFQLASASWAPSKPTPIINAWSDPATWGGQVPTSGDVTIPEGQNVVLDMDLTLDSLMVNGELRCANKNLHISAKSIMVRGHFMCGTEVTPYTKLAIITLRGSQNIESPMGTKVLGAMGGGRIDLHGETRTSWVRLTKTAMSGESIIELSEPPSWRVGDRIVIVSTSENLDENEERVISAISGNSITLNQPLKFKHFGERQMFSNGERVWDVETRGEVALLSRNIRIEGDAQSQNPNNPTQGFGGHIMIMPDSEAYISGVELVRMGQSGIKARYPFHWHLVGDVTGQYIRQSSIHHSFSRCVTVHGSHNALIENNVCYKHLGHGYFLEDGIETGNVFNGNISIRTYRPTEDVALIESDRMGKPNDGNSAVGPAGYWIANPNNIFTNNVAVASDGLGFWFDTKDKVTGPSYDLFPEAQSINPKLVKLGVFDDNLVHSSMMGLSLCNGPSGHKGYRATKENPAVYNRFTAYNAGGGAIWPCRIYHVFNDFRILDSGSPGGKRTGAFVSPNAMTVQNSLFVANSKLTVPPKPRVAISMYDQGVYFKNVHFENYTFGTQSSVFQANGGSEQYASSRVERATFNNSPFIYRGLPATFADLNSIVHDVDGSFGFGANSVLVPTVNNRADSRVYTTQDCNTIPDNPGIFVCPGTFASMDVWVRRNGAGALKNRTMGVRNTEGVEFNSGHGPQDVIPWVSTLVPLNAQGTNRELTYIFPEDTWSTAHEIQFDIDKGKPGQTAYFKVLNVPASVRFTGGFMKKVNSVGEVKNTANSWYLNGSTLHIAAKLNGEDWAETEVDVRIEW